MPVGSTVLLLHGSPGSPRSWDNVVAELGDRRPDVRTHRLVIPGWDQRTPGEVEALDFDQILDRLAAQVDHDNAPCLLVGFSAGALFAMGLARRRLWPLQGLLLLEPMGLHALEHVGPAKECQRIRSAFESYFAGVDAGREDAIRPIWDVWNPPGSFAATPQALRNYLSAWAPLNVRDGRAALRVVLDRDWFTRIDIPTVTTYGTAGPPVWQHFAQAIAQLIPTADARPLIGADHTALDTNPVDIATLIEELLPGNA